MKKLCVLVLVNWSFLAVGASLALAASAPTIGTDIARVAISQAYYADTSATGAEASYEWGFRNPAHLMTLLDYMDQGFFASGGRFCRASRLGSSAPCQ